MVTVEEPSNITAGGGLERAPKGVGTLLVLVVGLILVGGLYLVAVRGEVLFLDLAALSGMMFCF